MQFDTYFFDDYLKIQVYQNRSTAKANLIGKATIGDEIVFDADN